MFRIEIETHNDAFSDHPGSEIARLLGIVAENVNDGATTGTLFDYNGGCVGTWSFDGDVSSAEESASESVRAHALLSWWASLTPEERSLTGVELPTED